jgi:hypothetical protein
VVANPNKETFFDKFCSKFIFMNIYVLVSFYGLEKVGINPECAENLHVNQTNRSVDIFV